jgi:hypothetical protein
VRTKGCNVSTRDATVIAYYDSTKPSVLEAYIAHVQQWLVERIPSFVARSMPEVHATIIGLESYGSVPADAGQPELAELGGEMGLPALCQYFGSSVEASSMAVQFGGFLDRDYAIASRGKRLFERTVTAHRGQLMLLGWPVAESGEPTEFLDKIRRGAQQFGATHRYYRVPTDKDPDAYMVIGTTGELADQDMVEVARLRNELAMSSCRTPLEVRSLQVATYDDTRLPRSSTRTWPLSTFMSSAAGDRR